jgi:N-acetylglucosaminyldiphosphoundecaprenol N-acetyl-beta-D-mannosaminyltransferase
MTDNGSCYRSHRFRRALAATGIRHVYTRLFRPQTNERPSAPSARPRTSGPMPGPIERQRHAPGCCPASSTDITAGAFTEASATSRLSAVSRLWCEQRPCHLKLVAKHKMHSLYLLERHPWLERLFDRADLVHIDGMPLVRCARLKGYPANRERLITYVDWLPPVLSRAETKGWRVSYLSSTLEGCARGVIEIRRRHPGLRVQGHHGYFDASLESAENAKVVAKINPFSPLLLLVGMGVPRQEQWILQNLDVISAARILPFGAAVDFFCGTVATPPRWMGRLGSEWLYRLLHEPRRLAFQYLVGPLALAIRLALDVLSRRRTRSSSSSH